MGTSSIVAKTSLWLTCTAILCAALWISLAQARGAELKTIAILDFDLVDDQHELSPATVAYQRLRAIRDQLQEEFAASQLYRVVDLGSASELIKKYQSEVQLHACNSCELDIARSLHADRVLIGWVQKVSNCQTAGHQAFYHHRARYDPEQVLVLAGRACLSSSEPVRRRTLSIR